MIEFLITYGILLPLAALVWLLVMFLAACGALHLRDLLQDRGIL